MKSLLDINPLIIIRKGIREILVELGEPGILELDIFTLSIKLKYKFDLLSTDSIVKQSRIVSSETILIK
jgi:hypothetical protein